MSPGTAMNLANGASLLWIVLAGIFSLVVTVAWLSLAYRAVKARGRLAAAAELMVASSTRPMSAALVARGKQAPVPTPATSSACVVALLAFLVAPRAAQAFFDPPYVVPASPTQGDLVSVRIRGGECDTIIDSEGFPRITREGSTIRILFFSVHADQIDWCIYGEGEASFPVAAFPAGSYTLQVDRTYQTLFGDITETIGVVPFTVSGSAAAVAVPGTTRWSIGILLALIGGAATRRLRSTIRFGSSQDAQSHRRQ